MSAKPDRTPRPNIRRIAEYVQLSPTTVSLALRGVPSIPPETRARVLEAAQALHYVYAPRPLRPAKTKIRRLAFVTSDYGDSPVEANPFYGQVLRGAEQACNTHDASLTFSVLLYTHDPMTALPATLRNADVDGLVLAGTYPQALVDSMYASLQRPIVLVDNILPGTMYDVVMADDFGGGYLAAQHLISLGHRRITTLIGHPDVPSLIERYQGACAACRAAGLEPAPPILTSHTWEPRALHAELAPLLRALSLPHALFCTADIYADITLDVFSELGVRVPEQVSIVSFDDLDTTRRKHSNLSSIHNNPRLLGEIAIEQLIARIDGNDRPSQRIHVGVQLLVRGTTAPHAT